MSQTQISAVDDFVSMPLLVDNTVEAREYQLEASREAERENTLVALPTGTGKTIVSLLVSAARLSNFSGSRVLLLAPTKPLVNQHASEYAELLGIPENEVVTYTGDTRPGKRGELWKRPASVVVATPQCVKNDLLEDRISLDDVSHLVFDECHRASGDFPYSFIASSYERDSEDSLITALSASPGSTREGILEVCSALHISNICAFDEDDEILSKYMYSTEISEEFVDIDDEILERRDMLQEVYTDILKRLKDDGWVNSAAKNVSMGQLQKAQRNIRKGIQKDKDGSYSAMSFLAEAMKLNQALELIETQGVRPLERFFSDQQEQCRNEESKASVRLMNREVVQDVREWATKYDGIHPKQQRLHTHVARAIGLEDKQVIVFTESRDTVQHIVSFLSEKDKIRARRFVGQNDRDGDPGMTQPEQKERIEEFKRGEFDVLVSTSIAEEGLDIPQVGLVVFYEPVATGIRTIQRRGRTGRADKGEVVVLIGQGTRDEGYYYAAKNREREMKSDISDLKTMEDSVEDELAKEKNSGQQQLTEFSGEETSVGEDVSSEVTQTAIDDILYSDGTHIVADQRETSSIVPTEIETGEDVELHLKQLDVGDYIVSDRTAIERKSVNDFLDTLTGNRSLFEQLGDLSDNYQKPILLLEGEQPELFSRNIHPNAIRGALSSIALDYGVQVFHVSGPEETAAYLKRFAIREQEENDRTVQLHENKSTKSLTEQQEYIVSSVEDIGTVTSRSLLEAFGSVRAVFNASEKELKDVENVGEATAKKIASTITADYDD